MNPSINQQNSKVHVSHVRLSTPARAELLSDDERLRAERFRIDRDRERFIACRAALREILGGYLGLPPEQVVFSYGPRGKPYVAESEFRFNLSHSGDDALIAVAQGREVGIDLERRDARLNLEQLTASFLTAGERAFVESPPNGKRMEAFLSCWTRKEAWAKAIGTGIAVNPARFDVSESLNRAKHELRDPNDKSVWTIVELDLPGKSIGALAVQGKGISVSYRKHGSLSG